MRNLRKELKSLLPHNSVGTKETVIERTPEGKMIGKKKPPPSSPPPTAEENSQKQARLVTPTKKKIKRLAQGAGAEPVDQNAYIINTESAGPNSDFIILTASKVSDKSGGYLKHILNSIQEPGPLLAAKELVNPDVFDCRLHLPLFLRQSRENNSRVVNDPKKMNSYYRIAIVAYPNKDNFSNQLASDPYFLERKFAQDCKTILDKAEANKQWIPKARNDDKKLPSTKDNNKKILSNQQKKPPLSNKFLPWKNSHSRTIEGGRPLDHILDDISVGHILGIYFVDKDTGRNDEIYNFLKEYGMEDSFFSRDGNGKYSYHAITEYGFPEE